jgi:hypothetical protein
MGELINLRQVRKRRDRAAREAEAAANRTRFGRTKADKRAETDAADRARRDLDGKRLDDNADDPDSGDSR